MKIGRSDNGVRLHSLKSRVFVLPMKNRLLVLCHHSQRLRSRFTVPTLNMCIKQCPRVLVSLASDAHLLLEKLVRLTVIRIASLLTTTLYHSYTMYTEVMHPLFNKGTTAEHIELRLLLRIWLIRK